jgi:hypothetical protein
VVHHLEEPVVPARRVQLRQRGGAAVAGRLEPGEVDDGEAARHRQRGRWALRGRERVASGQSSNAAALDQVADALTEENLLVVVPFLAAGELLAMSFRAPRQHRYEQQEKGAGRGLTCSFSTEVDAIQYATQNGLESDE